MTKTNIIFWLSMASAGLGAITISLSAAPGDVVSNDLLVLLGAASAGLAAMVAMATRSQG